MKNSGDGQQIEALWSEVSDAAKVIILQAEQAAHNLAKPERRPLWLKVGEGLSVVRSEALRLAKVGGNIQHPRYRKYHRLILAKVPDLLTLTKVDHKSCQHALWMFNNREAVERFLATLDTRTANALNHPSSIRSRFDAAHKPINQHQSRSSASEHSRDTKSQSQTEADIDLSTLSLSAQEKIEAYKRRLDREYQQRVDDAVQAEIRRRIAEDILPHYTKLREEADRIIKARKGILTRQEYNKLLIVLSSDHVHSLGEEWVKRHDEASIIFRSHEKVLLNEKDSPTQYPADWPKTPEEWMARKAKVAEERKARRAARKAAGN